MQKKHFLAFIFLSLLSCGNGGTALSKDTLYLPLYSNPVTLNQVSAKGVPAYNILRHVSGYLLNVDKNLNIIPENAKSWEWSEKTDAKGRKEYILTFHLRKDVLWHDGIPFTSQDVLYTYQKIMDPASKAMDKIAAFENLVTRIETPDDFTVRVVYNKRYAPALSSWTGLALLPKHIYEKEPDFLKSEYNRKPIGTGPYVVEKWETGKYIKLKRFEQYWGIKPKFDRIIYRIISDENVALAALKKGLLDLNGLTPEQYVDLKNKPSFTKRFNLYRYTYFRNGMSQIAWNCQKGSLFDSSTVRRAMTHALNRKLVLKEYLHGLGTILSGPFYAQSWAYDTNIVPLDFDLKKSAFLLKKAGWKDSDKDGILDKDGKPFKFEIILGDTPITKAIALNLKENLSKIGVDCDMHVLEWSAFSQRLDERNFDAAIFGWSFDLDPDPYDLWHSLQITNGVNYVSYSNPKLDKLLELGRSTYDQKIRQMYYYQVHRILHEDQPYTCLFTLSSEVAATKHLKGIQVTKGGIWGYYPSWSLWYKE